MHAIAPPKISYYNAIVYCSQKEGTKAQHFLKFRTIPNNPHRIGKFLDFIKNKFASAQHVNFYCKESKQFIERIYLV